MTPENILRWFGFCSLLAIILASGGRSLAQQTGYVYSWDGKYSFTDGGKVGPYWTCLWLGYGTGKVDAGQLLLKPMAAASVNDTHSALVRSNFSLTRAWDISVRVSTDSQLRTTKNRRKSGLSPNPWEVAWLLAMMTDDGSAGLNFIFKPNGVELGAYRFFGEERVYLFTSNSPTLRLGTGYLYRLVSDGQTLTAQIDGKTVGTASLAPLADWGLGDKIGLYTEDAAARFGPVTVITY